jgi:hypothetical protein
MNDWTVSEDMGRWVKVHPCRDEAHARQVAAEVHRRRDRPLCPALVHIGRPDGTAERV